ncbi:ABC transporter substrate-binding protein, partial [Pelagibacterales bacterium SAG-MED10]|nr:ABC transporter substrate-binding protein [Pelagibacterales bacterium SAG-MED10]
AKETVDIRGIGFYTLGSVRKTLNDDQKKRYAILFEEYFLKSFSSRLAEYTNPEIDVQSKEILSENYTIVNSLLKGTPERPEVKIDWRIYTKKPENPLIRDLIIEGLSLARTQKEEFSSILNSNDNDINALFKTLEEFSKNLHKIGYMKISQKRSKKDRLIIKAFQRRFRQDLVNGLVDKECFLISKNLILS